MPGLYKMLLLSSMKHGVPYEAWPMNTFAENCIFVQWMKRTYGAWSTALPYEAPLSRTAWSDPKDHKAKPSSFVKAFAFTKVLTWQVGVTSMASFFCLRNFLFEKHFLSNFVFLSNSACFSTWFLIFLNYITTLSVIGTGITDNVFSVFFFQDGNAKTQSMLYKIRKLTFTERFRDLALSLNPL